MKEIVTCRCYHANSSLKYHRWQENDMDNKLDGTGGGL